jgi:hypothetical protein
MTGINWPHRGTIRALLQDIGSCKKALEVFRIQSRPILIFAGFSDHVLSGASRVLGLAD